MRYVLLFVYLVVSILLFTLNWDLFPTALDVDFGFSTARVLPFFVLQIFGGMVLGIFAVVDGLKDAKRESKILILENKVLLLEKDAEIASLKKEKENKDISTTNETQLPT